MRDHAKPSPLASSSCRAQVKFVGEWSSRRMPHGSISAHDRQNSGELHVLRDEEDGCEDVAVKVYCVRWFVLAILSFHTGLLNLFWVTFSPISGIASCYYGVSLVWINALIAAIPITYLTMCVPASLYMNKLGLRSTIIAGGCVTTAGAWLRFVGADSNLYWVLLIGQFVLAVNTTLEWNAASLLSFTWFPPHQTAMATSIGGAIAPTLGVMVGLAVGPFVVQSDNTREVCAHRSSPAFHDWQERIHQQLLYYLLTHALVATVLLLLSFFVPAAPTHPPSFSRKMATATSNNKQQRLIPALSGLCKNGYFVAYSMIFGLMLSLSNLIATVIDEVLVKSSSRNLQPVIGYIGLGVQASAATGLAITGKWLDCTKAFYITTLVTTGGAFLALISFSLVVQLQASLYAVALLSVVAGTLVAPVLGIGFEYSAEMTYPIPEQVSAGILNLTAMVGTLILLVVVDVLVQNGLAVYCLWLFSAISGVSAILAVFVKPTLKRRQIESDGRR